MRKKMPARPYYGELEVGETFPDQSKKKKKKVVKKKTASKVKPVSHGKGISGGVKTIKTATEIRRAKQRKILESMD